MNLNSLPLLLMAGKALLQGGRPPTRHSGQRAWWGGDGMKIYPATNQRFSVDFRKLVFPPPEATLKESQSYATSCFALCVYGKSLSVFFSAEPQLANFLDIYCNVPCYALFMNVNWPSKLLIRQHGTAICMATSWGPAPRMQKGDRRGPICSYAGHVLLVHVTVCRAGQGRVWANTANPNNPKGMPFFSLLVSGPGLWWPKTQVQWMRGMHRTPQIPQLLHRVSAHCL